MNTRRVAIVGLNEQLDQALGKMMRSFSELSDARWQRCDAGKADVLIFGPDSEPSLLRDWLAAGKPSISIIAEGTHSTGHFELRHPFRSAELLAVLDDAEQLLRRQAAALAIRPAAQTAGSWVFAESLRSLPRRDARGLWYRTDGAGGDTIYVRDDLMFIRADVQTLERLRTRDLALSPLQSGAQPPAGTRTLPGFALGWYCALHGAPGLAPWLEMKSTWRLRQWPDFGLVGGTRDMLELAALLGRHRLDTQQLIACSGQPAADVHRFLNACAMAGLLAHASDSNASANRSASRGSIGTGISELFQVLQHAWTASG